jgi:hypothetical protein
MYRFVRTARPRTAANVPAALQFSAQVTEHLNRTYGLNMKAGIELFGKSRLHWHYEAPTIDEHNHLWLEGSMKDQVISLLE